MWSTGVCVGGVGWWLLVKGGAGIGGGRVTVAVGCYRLCHPVRDVLYTPYMVVVYVVHTVKIDRNDIIQFGLLLYCTVLSVC